MIKHDLTVVDVMIDDIAQHPDNANQGDVDALEQSIMANGFYSPILIQESSGYIIAGNHRYLVAVKQGWGTIPGIVLNVDDIEAKRIMVADNRIARLGFDDEAQMANLLESIYQSDAGLAGTGYDFDDLTHLLDQINQPLTAEDFTDLGAQTKDEHPKGPKLAFSLTPVVDDDGFCTELTLARPGYKPITTADLNAVRRALGHEPYSADQLATFGVPAWERS